MNETYFKVRYVKSQLACEYDLDGGDCIHAERLEHVFEVVVFFQSLSMLDLI